MTPVNCFMAMTACVMLLGCAFPALGQQAAMAAPADAREFMRWMKEARDARTLSERLRTQSRVLKAIAQAESALLSAALQQADEERVENTWTSRAWARLTELDEGLVLRLLASHEADRYDVGVMAAYAHIARKDPDRAYGMAQQFAESPQHRDERGHNWLVRHIMHQAGAVWFRKEGVQALARFSTLSHPEMMATGLFEGCVEAATTAEQRLALLDLFIRPGPPTIKMLSKGDDPWEYLLPDAAREDLPAARGWVERHFPGAGSMQPQPKLRNEGSWMRDTLRLSLFGEWSRTDARAAADWLMTQRGATEEDSWDYMGTAARALAGPDDTALPVALDWLQKQTRRQYVPGVVADWMEHAPLDSHERRNHETITRWMAGLEPALREPIQKEVRRRNEPPPKFEPITSNPLLIPVLPEAGQSRQAPPPEVSPAKQREESEEQVYHPVDSPFVTPWIDVGVPPDQRQAFDVPPPSRMPPPSQQAIAVAQKIAHQYYHDAPGKTRAGERLAGLEALEWMTTAPTAQLGEVLVADLQPHQGPGRLTFLADDLVEAWVERDWRGCEAFLWEAPLPARTRAALLIQAFIQAALRFPDEVLPRLQEHIRAGRLDEVALNASSVGQRSPDFPSHRGNEITASLARGWTLQGDMAALTKIQALPLKWQPCAFEEFTDCFTNPAAGLALLDMIVKYDATLPAASDEEKRLNQGLHAQSSDLAGPVLGRLATLSPLDAKAWLEADPARLLKVSEFPDSVNHVHYYWRRQDPKAADAWLKQVRP